MKKKIALITGVTGQDGAYLLEFLLKKNYIVHGIKRRTSLINTQRIDHIFDKQKKLKKPSFILHHGDLTDSLSLQSIIKKTNPDEIYNLAAQSHVAVSFEQPEYTANSDALGILRILESVKTLNKVKKIKIYQASTSELYGKVQETRQSEKTPFYPRSPYGVAKLYAFWIVKNYREAYDMFACNGILFNHESPLRGETFVTKKIVKGLVRIKLGYQDKLTLGNLYAKRDWGHARDYVKAMWLMLQQKKADDFVIATGKQYSIKYFIKKVLDKLKIKVKWVGKGVNEKALDENNNIIIECSKKYFRPTEVQTLLGNPNKAKKILKWKSETTITQLINEMIEYEIQNQK
ncbi:GDP-mannose 4,6-dehydratase [Candidatus Pelagibacter ubique]|nr:GDP-mannose 4,6-dehydratase [Candidatus Pelagibacter ubique]